MDPMKIDALVPTDGNGLKIRTTNLLVTGVSDFAVPYLT